MTEILDVNGINLYVNRDHRFGTDAVKLAEFINPKKNDIICDLCTGCGIIPILLSKNKNIPKNIYGIDLSLDAISLLKKTIKENSLDLIQPILMDLKDIPQNNNATLPIGVNIVTVNPPYYKAGSGKLKASNSQATARHELYCEFSHVAAAAAKLLKFGGYLKMCHIPERIADVIFELRKVNIEPKEIKFIHGKNNVTPWLFLLSGKKGGKAGVKIKFTTTNDE